MSKHVHDDKGRVYLVPIFLLLAGIPSGSGQIEKPNMVFIDGGSFVMGDVFDEGGEDEKPVHRVTLDGFYIASHEVTVGEFRAFAQATGYKTSAEGPVDPDAQEKLMEEVLSRELSEREMEELHQRLLQYSGTGYWDAEKRQWRGYEPHTNWMKPGFDQAEAHPVMAVSWVDAIHYCNWLSRTSGLPVAYDLETGGLLDENGVPTTDVTKVKGYRLPTEAEWEYAAREGGRKVRFGNGKDVARSSEINFRGDEGDYDYLELGEYKKRTMPVGSYPPNTLGLYDMSGNAWEWVSDNYARYRVEEQTNPYVIFGNRRTLRGGRWGGDAFSARVFHRSAYPRNDRCNNAGFRVARSSN